MQNPKASKFQSYQNLYFKVTWVLLMMSVALAVIGYFMVQAIVSAPLFLVQFTTFVLYYLVFHFFYGVLSLFYYLTKIKNKMKNLKIYKTLMGILISPISAFAAYIAVFLIAISACSAS
jgi:hypothetical protein